MSLAIWRFYTCIFIYIYIHKRSEDKVEDVTLSREVTLNRENLYLTGRLGWSKSLDFKWNKTQWEVLAREVTWLYLYFSRYFGWYIFLKKDETGLWTLVTKDWGNNPDKNSLNIKLYSSNIQNFYVSKYLNLKNNTKNNAKPKHEQWQWKWS